MGSIVITTIQAPTPSVASMVEKARENGMRIIAIGDKKTPLVDWPEGTEFVSLNQQKKLDYSLVADLPENHYARKNVGYLLAMSRQSALIFDTDDDNAPLDSWRARSSQTAARPSFDSGWINA